MIKTLNDKVAVKVQKQPTKSVGGIELLRSTTPDAPLIGEVISVGPGIYNKKGVLEKLEVAVGNIVAFPHDVGIKFEDVTILRENEIIAVIG